MSEQPTLPTTGVGGQLRTLAVRITEDLWAQLDIVAQLTGQYNRGDPPGSGVLDREDQV